MLRMIRLVLTVAVTLLGVAVVLAAVLIDPDTDFSQRMTMVLLGVVLLEAAAWKRNNPFLPSERKYHDLRAEVDLFILMVRRMNAAVINDQKGRPNAKGQDTDTIVADLHQSVDRMVRVAGIQQDAE